MRVLNFSTARLESKLFLIIDIHLFLNWINGVLFLCYSVIYTTLHYFHKYVDAFGSQENFEQNIRIPGGLCEGRIILSTR